MVLILVGVGVLIGVVLLFGQMIVTEVLRGLDEAISLWHRHRKERKPDEQDVRPGD